MTRPNDRKSFAVLPHLAEGHETVRLLLLLPLLAGALWLVPAPATAQDTTSIVLQRRIYSTAPTRDGEMELVIDLYRPVDRPPRGAVVLMHGGGFTDNYVDIGENKIYGQALAQRGYLGAAIQYRLDRDAPVVDGWARAYALAVGGLDDPRLVGAIKRYGSDFADAVAAGAVDMIAAVEWLRDHAGELGFDPDHIALFGASAGGITALTTTYAMELYGEEDLDVAGVIDLRGFLLRADTAGNPFDPDEPPLLMLHGEDDESVPLRDAEEVFRLAREAGTPVELYTSEWHGHDLQGTGLLPLRVSPGETVLDHIDAFLEAAFAGESLTSESLRQSLLQKQPTQP